MTDISNIGYEPYRGRDIDKMDVNCLEPMGKGGIETELIIN